jgi:hypothetical protein
VSAYPPHEANSTAPALPLLVRVHFMCHPRPHLYRSFTSRPQHFQRLRHLHLFGRVFVHFRGTICRCCRSRQTVSFRQYQHVQWHFLQRILLFYYRHSWLGRRKHWMLLPSKLAFQYPIPSFSRHFMAPRLRCRLAPLNRLVSQLLTRLLFQFLRIALSATDRHRVRQR